MTAINAVTDLSREGDVAVITLNHPPVNALNESMRDGLIAALADAGKDSAAKAILLICGGRTFIAGADISEFDKVQKGAGFKEAQDAFDNAQKPIVAAIHGTALGGGLEVAMSCHYRVAVGSAKFGQPEVNLGLIPGAGGTQRLTKAVGKSLAMDMILTGRRLTAREALAAGLVSRVVASEALLAEAKAMAHAIAKASPAAARAAKAAANAAVDRQLDAGLSFEREAFYRLFDTRDQKEGMRAFMEKRSPVFEGR